jgi:hypothetical protein
VPLVNLHSGDMVEVPVPGGLCYETLSLHHSLTDLDLLCSVPMMKTHALATVTLGLKNLVGLYPGTVYGTVRSRVHDQAAERGSPGIAYETLDISRAATMSVASGSVPATMMSIGTSVPWVGPSPSMAEEPSTTTRPSLPGDTAG